eukprot:1848778-Amphidinium_carterae.1
MVDAMAAHGADHMPLMVLGRWKSSVMPAKYTRNHGAICCKLLVKTFHGLRHPRLPMMLSPVQEWQHGRGGLKKR